MAEGQVVAERSLVEENEMIRDWARELAADSRARWEFVCECGDPQCNEHVKLTLSLYDGIRREGEPIFAPGHLFRRARAARALAKEVQAEARAVRNQAEQQIRRSGHLGQLRRGPYPELICVRCGYGVCVPEPPLACPMCHSTEWRYVHA